MRTFIFTMALSSLLVLVSAAIGQPPQEGDRGDRGLRGNPERMRMPQPIAKLMSVLDKNRDGTLSTEEIENAAMALKSLDKNGDGAIQRSELGFRQAPERRPSEDSGYDEGKASPEAANPFVARLMARDTNGDGKLSKEEAGERMASFFGRMDSDSDGFLTKPEIETMARRFSGGGGGSNRRPAPKSKDHRPPFDDDQN